MAVIVTHDREGRVHGVVIGTPEAPPVAGFSDMESQVGEVTAPEDFQRRLEEAAREGEERASEYLRNLRFRPKDGAIEG